MSNDRNTTAIAVLVAVFAVALAVARPHLIPALGVGLAAFMAAMAYLKL
ncbi:hypothetical protein ACIP9H_34010 [Streptomyces sp. NPDC088732]